MTFAGGNADFLRVGVSYWNVGIPLIFPTKIKFVYNSWYPKVDCEQSRPMNNGRNRECSSPGNVDISYYPSSRSLQHAGISCWVILPLAAVYNMLERAVGLFSL